MGNSKHETAKYIEPNETTLEAAQLQAVDIELDAFAFTVDEKEFCLNVVNGTELSYYTPPFQLSKSVDEHTTKYDENGKVSCRIDEENSTTYELQRDGTFKVVNMGREM